MSANPEVLACDDRTQPLLYESFAIARGYAEPIARVTDAFGSQSVRTYLCKVLEPTAEGLQSRDDFLQVVDRLARRRFSGELVDTLVRDLKKSAAVLTANHQGVDCFAQSHQGSLLFTLGRKAQDTSVNTGLILSCGNIPLDNITYPQGLLMYDLPCDQIDQAPRKLPILPNSCRRWAVSIAPSFDGVMIERASKAVERLMREKQINPRMAECIQTILREDYGAPEVLDIPDYSGQSVAVNRTLWNRILPNDNSVPRPVYLELENVVIELLKIDCDNDNSLVSQVLFNSELRRLVLETLEGNRACWCELRKSISCPDGEVEYGIKGWGTHFFWGLSANGRKFALVAEVESSGEPRLWGWDNQGNRRDYSFNPNAISCGIHNKQLIPSVFTCFLTLALARGVKCLGGYYQASYLPDMQTGLVEALKKAQFDQQYLDKVGRVPTDTYLSGMQTVMTATDDNCLVPAGPIELIAAGGLSRKELVGILSLSVNEAHQASMLETLPDIAPSKINRMKWKRQLARECAELLSDKVIRK